MPKQPLDVRAILEAMATHQVDFIVVGGYAGVLQGAPLHTLDLDIVHSRTPDNLARLSAALAALDAQYRLHAKRIVPSPAHLATNGHHLLDTNAGSLDVLGTIVEEQGYDELLPHTDTLSVRLDLQVRVLRLEKLIELKEKLGRPKDLLAAIVLRETLDEKRRLQGGASTGE
jgi:hypothetical protein